MVPTIRPSAKTSILAPTRCGVEPVVETIVTSAAGSPRSRAAATAAKTSRFTRTIIGGPGGSGGSPLDLPDLPMDVADLIRLRACDEGLVDDFGAVRRRDLTVVGVDVREGEPFGHIERHAGPAGERGLHELRPDRQRSPCAAETDRLVVVEARSEERRV